MDYELLGAILKEARVSSNLTQAQVADHLNVTYQNVSSWERGKSKIDIDSLVYLCCLYHLDCAYVLGQAAKEHLQNQVTPNEIAPTPDESEVEAIALKLYDALVSAGWVRPGQDITEQQLLVLDGMATILSALFDDNAQ